MSRKLTFVVTLPDDVTDLQVEGIKGAIINQITEDWEKDIIAVHVLPEQLRLTLADE